MGVVDRLNGESKSRQASTLKNAATYLSIPGMHQNFPLYIRFLAYYCS